MISTVGDMPTETHEEAITAAFVAMVATSDKDKRRVYWASMLSLIAERNAARTPEQIREIEQARGLA